METFIKTSAPKVGSYISQEEKEYIEENLLFYIDKKKIPTRESLKDGWYIMEDQETLKRRLLLDYILKNFNLRELYTIFFSRGCYSLYPGIIAEEKREAVKEISEDDAITSERAKQLRRKISDMNPILFGLILEFVHESDLFWDDEKDEFVPSEFF